MSALRALFEVGRAHNCKGAWVLTDRSNIAAIALYSSIGGVKGKGDKGRGKAMLGYAFDLTERSE
jgi:hypothetical protein